MPSFAATFMIHLNGNLGETLKGISQFQSLEECNLMAAGVIVVPHTAIIYLPTQT